MKRFLVILLCFSCCFIFRSETVIAAPHVVSSLHSGHTVGTAAVPGREAVKAENMAPPKARQNTGTEIHQAAGPEKNTSPQGFMDAELVALLLLIMVLGMLYMGPSR